jgi:hyperosmotically inducible protein
MKVRIAGLALGAAAALSVASIANAGSVETAPVQLADNQAAPDADDTAKNARDRDGTTLTPMDQGTSDRDVAITQQIRKSVVAHDGLSTNAKNVKIITTNGVVTLRGPVKNADEKNVVASLASKTSGVTRVDDQTEIERN